MKKLTSPDTLDEIWQLPLAIVFKHSLTCAHSQKALWAVEEFYEEHPDLFLYVLRIQRFRGLSISVAERSGIAHASPQVLVLRRGIVTAVASHGEITTDWLCQGIRQNDLPYR